MSIINQMLKDLEDRKESTVKGQDGIISHTRGGRQGSPITVILLTLISIILLAAVVYLLWATRVDIVNRQQLNEYIPPIPQTNTSTIASLIEQSDNNAPADLSIEVGQPSTVVSPSVAKPGVTSSQPQQEVTSPPTREARVSPVADQHAQPAITISHLEPAALKGSWQSQKLTILGKNFRRNSEVLVCWPAKCVTLKGYRVNYISPGELNISLTTGIREEHWHLTVLNPDGSASNSSEFMVSSVPSAASPSVTSTVHLEESDNEVTSENSIANDTVDTVSKRIIPMTAFQQAEEYYLEANRLENGHKSAQALILWEKAVLLVPEHHASRQILIDKLIAAARTVEAEGHIKQAIELFPNYPIYVQKLAQIRMSQGEIATAIAMVEDSIELGVVNAELYAFAGALYQRNGNYQKSIEHYQRALSLSANNGIWWMGLGISFEQSGQDRKALSSFKQAQNSGTLSRKLNRYVKQQMVKIESRIAASSSN